MRWILILVGLTLLISNANGLNVVVTFPNLKYDLKLIAPNDTVVSITKPGVDPHNYQLTPKDVATLKRADVIISTAHTPFEIKIRELVESGEIKAELIEIPKIPGIRILKNPDTGLPNLHMPIYDPHNYEVFLRYVAKKLSQLNPNGDYIERAEIVCKRVEEIVSNTKKLNAFAVADLPVVQYAVSWLNVTIRHLLIKEPGLPALPEDVRAVENMKNVQLVVVTDTNSTASQMLKSIAEERGIPVLVVPSPIEGGSILKKLKFISEEVNNLKFRKAKKSPDFGVLVALLGILVAVELRRI